MNVSAISLFDAFVYDRKKSGFRQVPVSQTSGQYLAVVRGLPGSGKSTLAKAMTSRGFVHLENDMYLERSGQSKGGDLEELNKAIAWVKESAVKAIASGKNVVISNCCTEMAHVAQAAVIAYDYGLEFLHYECYGNYGSVHDVTQEALDRMSDAWEVFDLDALNANVAELVAK